MRFSRQVVARGTLALVCLSGTALSACQGTPESSYQAAPPENLESYRLAIQGEREARERAFRDPDHSPVPREALADWKGLEFYAVDPAFRIEARLQRHRQPRPITIPDTGGEERRASEMGYFLLDLGAGEERLPLFRMLDGGHWFLPFLDATTEIETYPAGRYLDVEELEKDRFRLDFNAAYNPYCAYGGDWSCPITPETNRLKAAVRAGERGYRYLAE